MCRIGFPLCLNFVQILKLKSKTSLESLMGESDFIPVFGKSFMLFFPTVLIVLCLFNLFNIYGRFMNMLGFYSFGFQNQYSDDKIDEGNEALNKMRLSFEREINDKKNSINTNAELNSNLIYYKEDVDSNFLIKKL